MRSISKGLAGLCFLLLIGIVGGMEQGIMPLTRGLLSSGLCVVAGILFASVGGLFE